MEDQKIIDLIREGKQDKAFVKLYAYLPVIKEDGYCRFEI